MRAKGLPQVTAVRSFLREACLIAAHDLRRALRSRRVHWLFAIYGLVSLFAVWGGLRLAGRLEGFVAEAAETAEGMTYESLYMLFGADPDHALYLAGIPAAVLLVFGVTRALLPWLAVLIGFDRIATDVQTGAARFLVLRARRASLVLGRFLSGLALLVGFTVAIHLVVLVAGALWIDEFGGGRGPFHLVRYWLLVLPVGLAWLGLVCLLSSVLRPPLALFAGLGVLLGTIVLGGLVHAFDSLSVLGWALPGRYADHLHSHLAPLQLLGVVGLGAFAAIFLALACWTFERRDL